MRQQATAWVIGHVAGPPETHGEGSSRRTKLRVLSNSSYFDRHSGTWVDREVSGTDVTCWGDLARNVAESIRVGDPVLVHGRLEENRWTDKEGNNRRSMQLIAELVAHDLNRGTASFVKAARSGIVRSDGRPSDAADGSTGRTESVDPDGVTAFREEPVPAGAPF